jgi:hypothetical protein
MTNTGISVRAVLALSLRGIRTLSGWIVADIADHTLTHLPPAAARLGALSARPKTIATACVLVLAGAGWIYLGFLAGTSTPQAGNLWSWIGALCRPAVAPLSSERHVQRFGGRSGQARGMPTGLDVHRLSIGPELRFQPFFFGYGFSLLVERSLQRLDGSEYRLQKPERGIFHSHSQQSVSNRFGNCVLDAPICDRLAAWGFPNHQAFGGDFACLHCGSLLRTDIHSALLSNG